MKILSAKEHADFGPTLAAEELGKHGGSGGGTSLGVDKDPVEMPPTQLGWALQELGIAWIAAHSPQAKGRVERNFATAQDRLVKGMRVAGVKTIEQPNEYLTDSYLVWWNRELTMEAAPPNDAHRPLCATNSKIYRLVNVRWRRRGKWPQPLSRPPSAPASGGAATGTRTSICKKAQGLASGGVIRLPDRGAQRTSSLPAEWREVESRPVVLVQT